MSFDYGEVLLAHFPFTDQSASKVRPVLVVSAPKFSRGGDVVVLPISSKIRANDEFGFLIAETAPYYKASGLRMSSTIKWTKPMTITDEVITRRLGRLPPEVMAQVVVKLHQLFAQ